MEVTYFVGTVPTPGLVDITYVATEEGWLYLAAIKDLWNWEIVGYAMIHCMTQDLVGRALFRAVAARRPPKGLIFHSDRGSQYCSHNHQKLMKQFKMKPSMSRKGNCWDNASMESFFGTLKREMIASLLISFYGFLKWRDFSELYSKNYRYVLSNTSRKCHVCNRKTS